SAKRYRYTGKEKDEETGLYYHEARYYACWLGRWTSCDPAGLAEGVNRFTYVRDNPVRHIDSTGLGDEDVNPPPQTDVQRQLDAAGYRVEKANAFPERAEFRDYDVVYATAPGADVRRYYRVSQTEGGLSIQPTSAYDEYCEPFTPNPACFALGVLR